MVKETWCHEFCRVVTTDEVWNFLFDKSYPKKELTFKCPSPHCSAKLIKQNFKSYDSSGRAGFKLYPKERHIDTCPYRKKTKQKKPRRKMYYYGL